MKLTDLDIRDLDFRQTGNWPLAARVAAIIVIFIVVIGLGYWFFIRESLDNLHQVEAKEATLRTEFESKQAKAANLGAYKAQLAEMQRSFGAMLKQLPGKTEIDNLLQDISQTAQANGLKQDLFKPQTEVPKDFYAEKPIQIRVEGTYHEFGKFVSDVSALPRIVTLHNITITPVRGSSGDLSMNLTAKTYRYLEPGEQRAGKKGKKAGRK